jgi:predicted unusual protein kinase regulating ubiquinone biosynthesis (AarF/ABC1/UbiB family)
VSRIAGNVLVSVMVSALTRWLSGGKRTNAVSARAQAALARNVADSMAELKGVAMKAAQTLGYLDFMLSDDARAQLNGLLTSSRPLRASLIAQIFLEEQGRLPSQLFSEWSTQAFATASIGQVHRARLADGRPVAVKVQHPGIAEAVETDLRGAELLDRLVSAIFRGQEPGVILAELRERLSEECDYLAEARNQEEFRLRWAGRAGFQIPMVYLELSSRRILVSELSPGESFDSFLAHATEHERDRAGELIYSFFIESFCRDHVFNADPHPGNYLFLDGDVVLLDFGCVRRLERTRVSWWKNLMRAYLERRFEVAQQLLIEAGAVPDPAHYDFGCHHRMVLTTYEFMLQSVPFRFDTQYMRRLLNARGRDNRGLFRSSVAKDLVFANRMALGLFALLSRLQARADYREITLNLLYEANEQRPAPYAETELSLFVAGHGQAAQ